MSLNIDQNDIEKSNDITVSSLAKVCEIILKVSRWEKILSWDDNPELKRVIEERNKETKEKK